MKLLFAFALCIGLASVAYSQNWPSFRGQNGSGVGESNALPATWDAEKSINVAWKTPILGLVAAAHSLRRLSRRTGKSISRVKTATFSLSRLDQRLNCLREIPWEKS
jgi:hypothetical protein